MGAGVRRMRRGAAAKNRFRERRIIIGIAIDAPKFTPRNLEDFVPMDCSDWTEERQAHYAHAAEWRGHATR